MPLTGPTLDAYNNLPGFPPTPKLGDLLNSMPVGNPSDFTSLVTRLYYSSTGSDVDGDGSQANPYATPQAAIDAIPFNIAQGSVVKIYGSAGRFPYPDCSRAPPTIRVEIYPDLSNPIISLAPNAVVFSLVPGKLAQWTGNVGAWSGAITAGTHWALQDGDGLFGDVYPDYGNVCLPSTSPNLVVAGDYDPNSFLALKVYEYATTFYVDNTLNATRSGPSPQGVLLATGQYGVWFVGIEFEVAGSAMTHVNTAFTACRFKSGSVNAIHIFYGCSVSGYLAPQATWLLQDNSALSLSCVLNGFGVTCLGSSTIEGGTVFQANNVATCGGDTTFTALSGIDFEGAGSVCISAAGYVTLFSSMTVGAAARTAYLTTTEPNTSILRSGGTVTGSVTGNAVTITNGSQFIGCELMCAGTLTAGGSQIVVGGNAGINFSALPANDLAAGTPQLCRAT